MNHKIVERLYGFLSGNVSIMLIVTLTATVSAFSVCKLLVRCKPNYDIKKRAWFFVFALGVTLFTLSVSAFDGKAYYTILQLSVSVVLSAFLLSGSKPSKRENDCEKGNAAIEAGNRLLNELKAKMQPSSMRMHSEKPFVDCNDFGNKVLPTKITEKVPNSTIAVETGLHKGATRTDVKKSGDRSAAELPEVDFSHVKNVMARLEYYKLNPSDKRQVNDLEAAILRAENGVYDGDVRNKINTGLGALLKIMAKYGV